MKTVNLIQRTPEWHAHRAQHFNASDAPAMMSCSPYKSRQELIHELATGIDADVDEAKQRIFDDGHRFEALARPLAEKIIGAELFPVVGVEGKYSASFDGLTMIEDEAFEHKTLNEQLRAVMYDGMSGNELPMLYRVQMEHQCMVSGVCRVLFMASKWQGDELVEERHCWYYPDMGLRAQIIAGWQQLEADVAAYVPVEVVEPARAEPTQGLPAVSIQFSGQVALTSNLDLFGAALRKFVAGMNKDPQDDQAFANLEAAVKTLQKAQDALEAAEAGALAQTASVDDMRKTVAMLIEIARSERLAAEKLVKAKKEQIRLDAVQHGVRYFRAHIEALNERLGGDYMPLVPTDFPGAIKGKRTIESLRSAIADELARAKIAASQIADRIQLNARKLDEAGHAELFADRHALVIKETADLAAVIEARILRQLAEQEKKLEAERARIRAEEQAKAQREADARAAEAVRAAAEEARQAQAARDAEEAKARAEADAAAQADQAAAALRQAVAQPVANVIPITRPTAPTSGAVPTLKLGQISERLGVGITAAFLKELGFEIAMKDRASCLFHEHDFPLMCDALISHIQKLKSKLAA